MFVVLFGGYKSVFENATYSVNGFGTLIVNNSDGVEIGRFTSPYGVVKYDGVTEIEQLKG